MSEACKTYGKSEKKSIILPGCLINLILFGEEINLKNNSTVNHIIHIVSIIKNLSRINFEIGASVDVDKDSCILLFLTTDSVSMQNNAIDIHIIIKDIIAITRA
jgi:hypothetical protein